MKRLIQILSILVGCIFLLSGYAKAADAAYFSYILQRSGGISLAMLAPAIIMGEILLGLMLVFRIRQRLMAWLGIAMTFILTIGFAYMHAYRGMFTCGCFGHLDMLNLPLRGTIVRNSITILLLLLVALKGQRAEPSIASWRWILIGIGAVIGSFATGLTFAKSDALRVQETDDTAFALADSPMGRWISTSQDSTYLVFFMASECDRCYNSIGNVQLYKQENRVDSIICLAVGDENTDMDVPFAYTCYPLDTLLQLTDDIPTIFLVRHDSVVLTRHGGVLAPRLLLSTFYY